jgi:hypothetical protein
LVRPASNGNVKSSETRRLSENEYKPPAWETVDALLDNARFESRKLNPVTI